MTDLRPTKVTAPSGILRGEGFREVEAGRNRMKTVAVDRLLKTVMALAVVVATAGPRMAAGMQGPDLLDLMARGKTQSDLGNYDAALRALGAIVERPDVPPAFRLEALVRLGVARRASGNLEGALRAFERVAGAPELDAATKALLVQALGEGLPGAKRWEEIWPRVSFAVRRPPAARPAMTVVWPDAVAGGRRAGDALSVSLVDANLGDLFRLVADVSGLNVVVFPGVRGKVTLEAQDEPFERVLDRALSPNGLAWQRQDNVLLVAPPDQMPPPRTFRGRRVALEFREHDLRKTLDEIAQLGGATVSADPAVSGSVTIRLSQVRWDQAFDVVARVNGLEWSQEGKAIKVTIPAP
jgi:hypothetical protein